MGGSLPVKHEVFISYSTKDKNWADAACAVLERHRVRCWIAPRDIIPGSEWGAAIIGGIDGCKIMVLVFSANANDSSQVRREVERAISKGIIVLPLRVEDVRPQGAMEYALSNTHWLDAFTPPMERQMVVLAESVLALLKRNHEPREPGPARRPGDPGPQPVPPAQPVAADGSQAAVRRPVKLPDRTDRPAQVAKLLAAPAAPVPLSGAVTPRRGQQRNARVSRTQTSVKTPCPTLTAYAGRVWQIAGTLILMSLVIVELNIMLGFSPRFKDITNDGTNRVGAAIAGVICYWIPGIPLGALPLFAGFRSRSGKARDTVGYGIMSLFFGPAVAVGYVIVAETKFAIVTGLLLGLGLVIAGVMAIIGRKNYQYWRLPVGTGQGTDAAPGTLD